MINVCLFYFLDFDKWINGIYDLNNGFYLVMYIMCFLFLFNK